MTSPRELVSRRLHLMVTPTMKNRIHEAAVRAGLSEADVVRLALDAQLGPTPGIVTFTEVRDGKPFAWPDPAEIARADALAGREPRVGVETAPVGRQQA